MYLSHLVHKRNVQKLDPFAISETEFKCSTAPSWKALVLLDWPIIGDTVSKCLDSVWILERRRRIDASMMCVTFKYKKKWKKRLIPSCHFSAHIVSIIQIGSVGSIMAIAIFPKQMAPVEEDAEQKKLSFFLQIWPKSSMLLSHWGFWFSWAAMSLSWRSGTKLSQKCFHFFSGYYYYF